MRFFYGWVIVACAFVVLLISNGLTFSGITVFDEILLEEFGWSRGALKFRDLLTFVIAGLLGPFAGALVDRFGVRPLMAFGGALLSVALFVYSRIESANHMYVVHTLFAVVLATAGLMVAIVLTSRWFVKRRGTAIGLTLVGTSLGGIVFPPFNTMLIQQYGWRTAFVILAAIPIVICVVAVLFIRDKPEDKGLKPLGDEGTSAASGANVTGLDYADALKTGTFWALAVGAMMTFYAILGISSNLFLHLRGLDFPVAKAAQGISLLFLFGLIGKFVFGFLADVFDSKRVLLFNLATMFVGSLCLSSMSVTLFWPFLILFGFGWGGIYTLLQVLTMECFGLKSAGKILGTLTVLDALGGGLGPWITGLLYDQTGSYQVPFLFVSALVLFAFACSAVAIRPRLMKEAIAATAPAESPA